MLPRFVHSLSVHLSGVLSIFCLFVCFFLILCGLHYLCCSHASKGKSHIWVTYEKRNMEDSVHITNLWEVRKQNSKQAIEMVLMDQTVIVVFFLFVVISHFYCMWCDFILWFWCFRVQILVLLSGKNCSLSSGTRYIVVLRIWFKT